ncbi:MAG TPA: hypothetical protein VH597_16875 [Verrucomicrobiae bacterium]|jgi:hypothetical protein|nr:hypothetical protein [Verrucomicrobiae bacterium]
MNIKPRLLIWKITASLVWLALMMFAGSASATLTVTTANQLGTANVWPFTPTWVVNTNGSLIAGMVPTATNGNFSQEIPGRSPNYPTVNTNLTLNKIVGNPAPFTTSTNYVSVGQSAGSLLVYTLPVSANGYNLTNVTVFGGWADNGRDMVSFTLLYSTVDNPTTFKFLTNVAYNPSIAGNTASANQVTISDSLGGSIAANVAAVRFEFTYPGVENGFGGIAAITVGGTPASSLVSPVISVTTSNQTGTSPFTPTWTAESQDLIFGLVPTIANGNFTQEASGGTPVLTDGTIGQSGTVATFATAGSGGGTSLIYTLTNTVNGSDITNIVVYSGWGDGGRDGQYYDVSYSTVAAPTTFIPLTIIYYNPQGTVGASANRVSFAMSDGSPLASGVANLKFNFNKPGANNGFDNNYSGISEIIVQGQDTAAPPPPPSPFLTLDTLPSYAETVVGDHVIFAAAFSNAPPVSLQWQFINTNGTATNDIVGATAATLTLSNVQLTNSGSYRLKAVNATNGAAAPSYSTATSLAVGPVPAAVNNVIMNYAGQVGLGAAGPTTNFFPNWTIDTNNDLIVNSVIGGNASAGSGSFGLGSSFGDPTILSDGSIGYFNFWPGVGGSPTVVSCGPGGGAGTAMTYTLDTSSAPNGFDLTNITVYGGWGDHGRDEQKYQILYSTISSPTVFNNLGTFDYNPNDPTGGQSATRVTLVPVNGALAANVAAVQINWNLQGAQPKNGWEGYSEILVKGVPSAPKPVLTQDITPLTADDVVGSTLTLTANFSGATSFQWQKNSTNLIGANSPTLTLNNLQPSDTATNGGYSLVASNAAGIASTRGCSVTVKSAPTPIGNAVVAYAHQTSDAGTFSPTWDVSNFNLSLIAGGFPSSYGSGDFNDPDDNLVSHELAGGLPVLTDSDYGTIVTGGPHPAFATCGDEFHSPPAGQFVIYALPSSANGYDLTNIMMSSGWNDLGRDADWGTISYATAQNPTAFIPIAVITNNPSAADGFANGPTVVRATVTPVSGVLATNVAYIMVDFANPAGVPNNYSGISQINVFGSPSATAFTGPVITEQNETNTFDWVVETPNLIGNQLPSSAGPGVFTDEGCNETNLTDGVIGFGADFGASCGDDGTAVPWIIFTPTNSASWNLTNIVVYTLWHDYGRDGQFYNLSYSTVSDPNTFIPLASVNYNPDVPTDGRASGNRVQILPPVGQSLLASNVAAVKFDFTPQGTEDFGWSGYTEIVLQGTNGPLTVAHAPLLGTAKVSGGNLVLSGSGGTAGAGYTLLMATNLTSPVIWTTNSSGNLDGAGSFSNGIPINANPPQEFFRVRLP